MNQFIHILTNPYAGDHHIRMKRMQEQIMLQDMPEEMIKIWECVPDKDSAIRSINLSHKMIIEAAMVTGHEYCMVLEDDCWFPHPQGFNYFMESWENEQEHADIYFGGTMGERQPDGTIITPVGMHCYIMNREFFSTFLSVPDNKHIDTALEGLGTFRVCYPYAAIQTPGFSSNLKKDTNYNVNYQPEDVYGNF